MNDFFIQYLDEILQMDEIKIKLLVGSDWCRTYTLGLKIWKKMKNKKGGSNWTS
jgi:hypothetical protein